MDLSVYRSEFPITESYIYVNHASVSPLPRRVVTAMNDFAEDVMLNGTAHFSNWSRCYSGLRSAAARLLAASPDEIAITKNTSEGLAIIANGLPWQAGDVVVGIKGEFPANYFPWLRLERRGVKLRWLELQQGRVDLDGVDRACRGARLLALSFVQYVSGFRVDLDAVGEICRRRGCLLVVDAVQGLGPFPVDVKRSGIHALAAGGHKWLLGPEGCGILFIDRDLIPEVEPVEFGWSNVEGWRSHSYDPALRPGASRYECGTLNTLGCRGLQAAIELFLEIGVEAVGQRLHRLAAQIATGVLSRGYELMTPREDSHGSGIVSFRKPGVDSESAVAALAKKGIVAAQRVGWIRTSPHFYASEEEINRLVDSLP